MAREIIKTDNKLFDDLASIIENRKTQIYKQANGGFVLMCWEIGKRIDAEILNNQRAEYGKQIVVTIARQLQAKYGNSFNFTNITRMIAFSKQITEKQIVDTVWQQLSWSHIRELLPLEKMEAKLYYANEVAKNNMGVRDLHNLIVRKGYERREIADTRITAQGKIPFNTFKDPYILDTLGLKENYLEADLEKAILTDIENFILEFGKGFAFIERQKRLPFNDTDYHLDLLFYHRELKRLIVVELKMEKFKPEFKGQMEYYLKWLNEYERKDGENEPIGIILCPKADRGMIEFMELDKSGIAVAEFWTKLPPKEQFEHKIQEIMAEAKERLERRKELGISHKKQIEYFYESKDDGEY